MLFSADSELRDFRGVAGPVGAGPVHDGASAESCGCAQCAGLRVDEGGGGVSAQADKPVWSLDQVIGNLTRPNAAWSPTVVTYSFRESRAPDAEAKVQFSPLSPIERELTRLGFELISDVANISFVEAPDDGGAARSSGRIYFGKDANAPDFEWGHAVRYSVNGSPRRSITGAEVVLNTDMVATRDWFVGGYNFHALMHEIGHTIGLPHPGDYNANKDETITYDQHAQYQQDSRQYTFMSYFSASNTGADHLMDSKGGVYSGATPLLHDVAALQALYGANTTTRAGDTVYGYNSTAGRAPFDFTINTTPIFTIWDAGGVDLLDFSQTGFAVNLDMNAGAFSDAFEMTKNISIAFGVTLENAVTGSADDRILGNEAANHLRGAGGADLLDGAGGGDHLEGGTGNDRLLGGDGDDLVGGNEGDDFVDGGNGRDTLFGDAGRDHMVGGADDDRLHGQDGDDLIGGQDGDDFIDGGNGRDELFGDAGQDLIVGGIDNDRLHGQDGDDLIGGQDGDDFIDGGNGRDVLFGDAGRDLIVGGVDNDRLHGQDGDDLIGGQEGDDFVDGGQGADTLFGDAGRDLIVGGTDNDRLHGQDGDDLIGGQDGDDFIDGGQGADNLFGDAGQDLIVGGTENDRLHGQDGDDLIGGQDGDDFVDGGNGRDALFGDAGQDLIVGGADDDRLHGQDGDDLIGGQDGNDFIEGGSGRDTLYGDAGDDVIVGGLGDDRLIGNAGADRFIFVSVADSAGLGINEANREFDRILDFDGRAGDRIDLSQIDADTTVGGDQAFRLVGGFSGQRGEAVIARTATGGVLELDLDGDRQADFRLFIDGDLGESSQAFVL